MTFNIYSFSIPLLLHVNASNNFFAEVGTTFELIPYKLGRGTEVINEPFVDSYEIEISNDFPHDKIDFGCVGSIGFLIPVKSYNLVLSANYHNSNSIQNIFSGNQDSFSQFIAFKIGLINLKGFAFWPQARKL